MHKKGQAALEFLMTYGLAILVVLVAVGALAYFGVLSPDRFLPSKCTLQSGIACLDHKVTSADVTVVVQNALGYDLTGVDVEVQRCGASSDNAAISNGGQNTFTVTCAGPITTSKFDGDINVTYTVTDTGLSHKNRGTLTARVE